MSADGAKIYLRVSTNNGQTTDQRRELESVSKRSGWNVVEVFEDNGVSGAKEPRGRPIWSRRGRSTASAAACRISSVSSRARGVGCGQYLHEQALDTTTPSGLAMFQMCGVFIEFERATIRERIMSGLARAKARGVNRTSEPLRLGRPPIHAATERDVRELRVKGMGILKIAKTLGIGTSVVQRVLTAAC
jgi:DNA invertase Pin-like site-specific DNA recombinase